MMKKILLPLFFSFYLISSTAQSSLKVIGTQLSDSTGKPIVLRGMSFGWDNWHSRFYTEGAVQWLHRDWGCNVVRAAMGIEPEGAYLANKEKSLRNITTVVDAAIKEKIYVIIDWHSHNINSKEAISFFTEMASKYGRYPNVIYEIFNEPDEETWPEVKAYATEVIKAIRSKDPDNIILVGSPHWDQDVHLPAADPIKGFDNIMYTLHYYAATHKQELRDRADVAFKKGLPLFISESAGMEATGDGAVDSLEWRKWIEWAEERKISWVTWSVSDKDESCSVLLPSASSEGNWKEKDLKESGRMVRGFITNYK